MRFPELALLNRAAMVMLMSLAGSIGYAEKRSQHDTPFMTRGPCWPSEITCRPSSVKATAAVIDSILTAGPWYSYEDVGQKCCHAGAR